MASCPAIFRDLSLTNSHRSTEKTSSFKLPSIHNSEQHLNRGPIQAFYTPKCVPFSSKPKGFKVLNSSPSSGYFSYSSTVSKTNSLNNRIYSKQSSG